MLVLFAENRWLIALPPIWLLGAGALVAVVAILAVYALLRAVAPRSAAEARASLRDGFLGPLAWLLLTFSAIAVAFAPLVPLGQIGRSLQRFVTADSGTRTVTIAPGAALQDITLGFRPQELERIDLQAAGRIVVRTQQPIEGFALSKVPDVDLDPGTSWTWKRAEGATNPFLGQRATLQATNASDRPVDLTIRWRPSTPPSGSGPGAWRRWRRPPPRRRSASRSSPWR
jgi:hypothetical protein